MKDPFHTPVAGCTCESLTVKVAAAFEKRELDPCEVHDPDAFKAAKVKAERDDHIGRAARIEAALDRGSEPEPELEPHPLATVVDIFTGRSATSAPLGTSLNDGLADALRGALGITTHHDGPDAA